jgi:hypothetical protein
MAIQINRKTVERVHWFLINYPETRDDDMKLAEGLWKQDVPHFQILRAPQFVEKMQTGEVTHFETIRRARARVQQLNPDLRGSNYGQKKVKAEKIKAFLRDN